MEGHRGAGPVGAGQVHEGRRLIGVRPSVTERSRAGGKRLLEVPRYKFQTLRTNLSEMVDALEMWCRYKGWAVIENRIKELGAQFGLKSLCCQAFWATEAACHLAICAYKPCVGLRCTSRVWARAAFIEMPRVLLFE